MLVRDLMSHPVVTLAADETLGLAEEIMSLARLRHLPVVDGDGRLVGLVTHRDLVGAQASTLSGMSPYENKKLKLAIRVAEVMRTDVESIASDAPAVDAAVKMREKKYGCMPVVDGDELVGIVTEADFLDLAIRSLRSEP
jgi:CBS domain-containing membrane protein